MSGFLIALEFLTIIGLRRVPVTEAPALARSLPWFSVIGLVLGALLAGLDLLLRHALPEPALSAVLITTLALLSGGLHLDGLADTCDGLFGGATPAQRLEIMRDSRTGSFGVAGVALVLLLKWSALTALPGDLRTAGLVVLPALSRTALIAAIALFPYARPQGLGKLFHEKASAGTLLIAVLPLLAAVFVLLSERGLVLVIAAFAFALTGGASIRSKIGGLTGDCYGALVEGNEAFLLLLLASGGKMGWIVGNGS